MAGLHELDKPIQQNQLQKLREPLENLQGSILQGHGRDYTVHIFLRFKYGQQIGVKQWIRDLANDITSAQQQYNEIEQYRQYGIRGRLFMSFFLSAKGYKYFN